MRLSSVFLALVGIFTLDYHVLHTAVALGYFILAPTGFLLVGFGIEKDGIKKLSIVCGVAALLAILVLPIVISTFSFKVGFAVPELTEALIISAWTILISAKLFEKPSAREIVIVTGLILAAVVLFFVVTHGMIANIFSDIPLTTLVGIISIILAMLVPSAGFLYSRHRKLDPCFG